MSSSATNFFWAIIYFAVAVRGKLRFGGSYVAIIEDQVGSVAIHGEATCAFGLEFDVIPPEVYANNFFTFEVLCDGVMGGEDSS